MRILAVARIGAVHHISPENIVRSSDGLIVGEIRNARVGLDPPLNECVDGGEASLVFGGWVVVFAVQDQSHGWWRVAWFRITEAR
jgi:hypothetical protein